MGSEKQIVKGTGGDFDIRKGGELAEFVARPKIEQEESPADKSDEQ